MASPTVALNSPANAGTVLTATPQLAFTGTDADGDAITYEIQIDTVNTFDSQGTSSKTTDDSKGVVGNTTGTNIGALGQSFTPATSYTANGILLTIQKSLSPTDNVTVYLRSTSITGTVLASKTIACSTLSSSVTIVDFNFGSSVNLSAGTTYYISIERSAVDATNLFYVSLDDTVPYAGGQGYARLGSTWGNTYGFGTAFDLWFAVYGSPLIDKFSATDTGFVDITNGAHTDPFTSGEQIGYTVQAGNALTNGVTYYWRVRGKDPSGSNVYGSFSSINSFTVTTSITTTQTQTGKARVTATTTKTQTGKARIRGAKTYTYEGLASLPTGVLGLANTYNGTQVTNVSNFSNTTAVDDLSANTYRVHQFEYYYGATAPLNATWRGRLGQAASARNVVLQVYNQSTTTWTTLATDSTTASGSLSTLIGSVLSSVANYLDANGFITFRVYQ